MSSYTIRDVERLLGLSRAVAQGFVDAGFVAPARGSRNELRFSFQDLIMLRTAQGLAAVRIPTRRIKQSLARLRAQLPPALPLSGIRISALGDRVVVQQGARQWLADSGQCLLDFDVAESGEVALLPRETLVGDSAVDWLQRAGELEASDPDAAGSAYRTAIERDPAFLAAYVNLGCLLQTRGDAAAARRLYEQAIERYPDEPLLRFNLGTALEELDRPDEAARAYAQAISLDPRFADAYYNLARICEAQGRAQEAIRHLASYRRLQQAIS